jgi:hypothetical protein
MMTENEPRRVKTGACCEHSYPIEVCIYEGRRRARCLNCGAYGPLCEDAAAARRALILENIEVNRTT